MGLFIHLSGSFSPQTSQRQSLSCQTFHSLERENKLYLLCWLPGHKVWTQKLLGHICKLNKLVSPPRGEEFRASKGLDCYSNGNSFTWGHEAGRITNTFYNCWIFGMKWYIEFIFGFCLSTLFYINKMSLSGGKYLLLETKC